MRAERDDTDSGNVRVWASGQMAGRLRPCPGAVDTLAAIRSGGALISSTNVLTILSMHRLGGRSAILVTLCSSTSSFRMHNDTHTDAHIETHTDRHRQSQTLTHAQSKSHSKNTEKAQKTEDAY